MIAELVRPPKNGASRPDLNPSFSPVVDLEGVSAISNPTWRNAGGRGQGAQLLEKLGWDDRDVIEASHSASRSFPTAASWRGLEIAEA
jgi:hypothetical protein